MNKSDCIKERLSARVLGLILLPVGLLLAVIGFIVIPVFGLFFSLPVLLLSGIMLAMPESKTCKLIMKHVG